MNKKYKPVKMRIIEGKKTDVLSFETSRQK